MTNPHNLLPGDRIVAVNNPDEFGTVATPEETRNPEAARNYLSLRRDRGGCVDFWSADSWKPAPITVGSWVRIIGPTDEIVKKYEGYIGEVVETGTFTSTVAWPNNNGDLCRYWTPENLRAVIAPEPVILWLQQYGRGIRTVVYDADKALQIADNARLDAIGQRDELQAQITKLADFITANIPGEPSQSAGAVDVAIRIMTEQRHAIYQAGRRIAKWVNDTPTGYSTDESRAWLAANAPELLPPVFKRGDLVWTGFVFGNARIITNDPMRYATVECMNDHGQTVVVPVASLRQAAETK